MTDTKELRAKLEAAGLKLPLVKINACDDAWMLVETSDDPYNLPDPLFTGTEAQCDLFVAGINAVPGLLEAAEEIEGLRQALRDTANCLVDGEPCWCPSLLVVQTIGHNHTCVQARRALRAGVEKVQASEPMSDAERLSLLEEFGEWAIMDIAAEVRRLRGEVDRANTNRAHFEQRAESVDGLVKHNAKLVAERMGLEQERDALRARLAQHEPEGERDETLVCDRCGKEAKDDFCPGEYTHIPYIPRWRYLAAQRILKGK